MTLDAPSDSAGPSSPPPPLPEGWLAQWEGIQRKWYFVQRTTGKSQWEIPTEPVILTPSTTPTSTGTGPSRVPSSRPEMNNNKNLQQPGGWPVAMTADGTYYPGAAKEAGYSSFLSSSQGNDQQGGLTQTALGMLGRFANHDTSAGQHNNTTGLHAYNQQQNQFGYLSNAQAGSYTGVAPQYQPPGQVDTGQAVLGQAPGAANATNLAMGPSPQSGIGLSQQLRTSSQGSLSSQFIQHVPPHTQFQQGAHTVPSGVAVQKSHADVPSAQVLMEQVGHSNYSPIQSQWHVGQQPQFTTKPVNNQPGIISSPVPDPLNQGHHNQTAVHGYTHQQQQQQQQNLTQHPFGPEPSHQNPIRPLTSPSLQPSHYSITGQAYPVLNDTGSLPSGTGPSYQSHFAQSHQGIPDGNRGYPISQPLPQQAAPASQPLLRSSSQNIPSPYGQMPLPQQGTYTANSHYMGFNPAQTSPDGVFPTSNQSLPVTTVPVSNPSFNTQPVTTTVEHYGMPFVPANSQLGGVNLPGSTWSAPLQSENVAAIHVPSVNHEINANTSASPQGPLHHNYQAFQSQPNQTVALVHEWTTSPGVVPSLSAMSDPQFVSGPWSSGIPPPAAGMIQPTPYGGPVGYGR